VGFGRVEHHLEVGLAEFDEALGEANRVVREDVVVDEAVADEKAIS
jgi:hypothetical protein